MNDKNNAVISAVAGSGKTTTLLKALELIPPDKKILFLAFNKSIANELKTKIGNKSNVRVITVHGLGYGILSKNIKDLVIENNKYESLYNEIFSYKIKKKTTNLIIENKLKKDIIKIVDGFFKPIGFDNEVNWKNLKFDIIRLCDLGRMYNVDLSDKKGALKRMIEIAEQYTISTEFGECEMAISLIKIGSSIEQKIDFTDMIYLPLIRDYTCDNFDIVFIDECQDLNTCQRELMIKSVNNNGGRFIAVGDRKQSIYSFAGADMDSYDKLCEIENTTQLPLSYTYRCGKTITNFVRTHINPEIIVFENNPVGEIMDTFPYRKLKSGDMVLCRQSFPTVSLCVKLISMGKSAHVIGIDTGNFITKTINDCKKEGIEFTMEQVFAQLYSNLEKLIEKVITTHSITRPEALDEPSVFMLDETIKIIESLTAESDTPEMVLEKIRKIFKETKSDGICLSTIHKSKGLEADRVFLLHPELLPSKRAITEKELEQEENLRYVAYTRAINVLGFIYDYNAYNTHVSLKNEDIKVKESKHIGVIGKQQKLILEIINVKDYESKYGHTKIYEMVDDEGNKFSKFGDIEREYLLKGGSISVGSRVSFHGIIKGHTEFRGEKITQIGKIY